MKRGLRGQFLPESFEDFQELVVTGYAGFRSCHVCREDFSQGSASTPAGWRETQISGICETCFDKLFAKDEDSEDLE